MKNTSRRENQTPEAMRVDLQDQQRLETDRPIPIQTGQDAEAEFTIGALIAAYLRPPVHVSSCFYCL